MFEQYILEIKRVIDASQALLERHLFIAAVLFFAAGWIFASFMAGKFAAVLEKTKMNSLFKASRLQESLDRRNIRLDVPAILAQVIKWSILLFTLMVSTDIMRLDRVSGFFSAIVGFLPNIYIAILIFFITLFADNFSRKIMIGNTGEDRLSYSKILGEVTRFSIWILAVLAMLYQLQIAQALVLSIFIAFLATLALAFGISFGLGGKDLAKKILDEIKDKIS